ncbi:hypothetical protein AB0J25_28455 [Streptomyces sp. NPDC049910]|uniref:MinD/ParA family ATP-binding protein n=1 Tax=Streptomyces sp. NPDC049910 TaxID=3155278 RepID=UPI00343AD00C
MRRLIAIGSVTGAPGVTTTALLLAALWPRQADGGIRPVVVEADASGGDLMIRFGLPPSPSLLDVAATAVQPYPGSLLGAVSELPFGVRAVVSVPGHGPCRQAVRLMTGEAGRRVLRGEDGDVGTVLLDLGRLGEDVTPLMETADHLVVVARGGAEPLTHVSGYGLDAGTYTGRLTLAVVGPCPYRAEEIAGTLGIEHVVFLPWDARNVAALSGPGRGTWRSRTGFRTPPLVTAVETLARRLASAGESGAAAGAQAAGSVEAEAAGRGRMALAQVPGDEGIAS